MAETAMALAVLKKERALASQIMTLLQRCPGDIRLEQAAREAVSAALIDIREQDDHLHQLLQQLKEHQECHAAVESLSCRVSDAEARVREFARSMTSAAAGLEEPLSKAKDLLERGRKAEKAGVRVGDIVAYAQRVSGTSSAPAYWRPGMPMIGFAPPAPMTEMMRAGALSEFAGSTPAGSLSSVQLARLVHRLDHPEEPQLQEDAADQDATEATGAAEASVAVGGGEAGSVNQQGARDRRRKAEAGEGDSGAQEGAGKRPQSSSGSKTSSGASAAGAAEHSAASNFSGGVSKKPKIVLDLDDLDSNSDSE